MLGRSIQSMLCFVPLSMVAGRDAAPHTVGEAVICSTVIYLAN